MTYALNVFMGTDDDGNTMEETVEAEDAAALHARIDEVLTRDGLEEWKIISIVHKEDLPKLMADAVQIDE